MSGGIAQLVAVGAQDVHLVGQPEVSFFRSNYKRHTNFAQTVERQVIQGNPTANGMSTVRFDRKGDLLGYVYLTCDDGTKVLTKGIDDWTANISKVELLIGGQVIDTQTSDFSQKLAPFVISSSYAKSSSANMNKDGLSETKFYPLRFSFCEHFQSMLPLIALQYHDVEIRITWGGTMTVGGIWECHAQYVYLDDTERTQLASMKHSMLITQTQRAVASGSKVQELNFNHPVKLIVAGNMGELYANNKTISITETTNKIKLQINGTDDTDFKFVDPHYTAVKMYYHTDIVGPQGPSESTKKSTIFVYPFCLDMSKYQPTGSLNFSRLDSARLLCDKQSHDRDIYAVNYNVLRIENGMGGLMYSN